MLIKDKRFFLEEEDMKHLDSAWYSPGDEVRPWVDFIDCPENWDAIEGESFPLRVDPYQGKRVDTQGFDFPVIHQWKLVTRESNVDADRESAFDFPIGITKGWVFRVVRNGQPGPWNPTLHTEKGLGEEVDD